MNQQSFDRNYEIKLIRDFDKFQIIQNEESMNQNTNEEFYNSNDHQMDPSINGSFDKWICQ